MNKFFTSIIFTIAIGLANTSFAETDEDKGLSIASEMDKQDSGFVDSVAKYRGTTCETVLKYYGLGRVFVAREALKQRMIDEISTFEALIRQLNGEHMAKEKEEITQDYIVKT